LPSISDRTAEGNEMLLSNYPAAPALRGLRFWRRTLCVIR
jgi:hypothetical protein